MCSRRCATARDVGESRAVGVSVPSWSERFEGGKSLERGDIAGELVTLGGCEMSVLMRWRASSRAGLAENSKSMSACPRTCSVSPDPRYHTWVWAAARTSVVWKRSLTSDAATKCDQKHTNLTDKTRSPEVDIARFRLHFVTTDSES